MILRREQPDDRDTVFDVHATAFDRPGVPVAPEALLVDDLRAGGDIVAGLSIVAVVEGDVVGHVVCSRARIDGAPALGLGPLGVRPARQRHGVGTALMHAVIAAADALDEPVIVILGDPAYYGRFGFVLATDHGVVPPEAGWAPYFQVRLLGSPNADLRGDFRYAAAFDRV